MHGGDRVSDVMRRSVVTVDKGVTVGVALDLMERNDVNHLVVTSGDRVVGVISVRDVMEGLGSSRFERIPARRIYVSALMTEPPITVEPKTSVREAVAIMLREGIGSLPVVEGGRLVGIVTETDLIRSLNSDGSIRELVKEDHPRIMPNERIVHARSIMLERGARILPVVEGGRLVGIVTERNLAKAFLDVRENVEPVRMDNVVRKILVEDVMIEAPRRIRGYVPLNEARDLFIDSGLPALPVVKNGDRVMGVLERRSLLRSIG